MAIGDIYRFSVIGDWYSVTVGLYTGHVKFLSVGATPAGFASYWKTNFVDLFKTYQASVFNTRQINFLSVNQTPEVSQQVTTGFPVVGTASGEAISYFDALVLSLRTAYAGRSYRGRMYLPGLTEANTLETAVTNGARDAIQTYCDDLVAGIGSGGASSDYQLGVWSHKLSVFTPVNDIIVRQVLGTQRRRRPGRGI